jgi:hypothetical protein
MTSDEQLRKLIEQEATERRARLARALANGGLPTEEEAKEAWDRLNDAFDVIEALEWRIEPIAKTAELAEKLPFAITLEDIGVLTLLARDIESRADDFQRFARQVRQHADSLLGGRVDQKFVAEQQRESSGA